MTHPGRSAVALAALLAALLVTATAKAQTGVTLANALDPAYREIFYPNIQTSAWPLIPVRTGIYAYDVQIFGSGYLNSYYRNLPAGDVQHGGFVADYRWYW